METGTNEADLAPEYAHLGDLMMTRMTFHTIEILAVFFSTEPNPFFRMMKMKEKQIQGFFKERFADVLVES